MSRPWVYNEHVPLTPLYTLPYKTFTKVIYYRAFLLFTKFGYFRTVLPRVLPDVLALDSMRLSNFQKLSQDVKTDTF